MEKGFQIEIQKDLTEKEHKIAISFINNWISKTCGNNMKFHLGGRTAGYKSYLRRSRFGYMIDDPNGPITDLVFRRISTHKRIFGIVKAGTMVKPDNSELKLNRCRCPKHRGGERVIWREGKPETFIYAVVGSIKNNKES